jgi:hypothetical protein
LEEGLSKIKELNVDTSLHLSGTPYRILMGSEFKPEDIIAFYQFSDIIDDKEKYDHKHINEDDYKEWSNPYYGFPQMIRFAFNPNESSRQLIEDLKKEGKSAQLNELFRPQSITKDTANSKHKYFVHEKEVKELLSVIDGSEEDENLLGFLNYEKLKEGKMCRHMVFVLPFCASCDAMEQLLKDHKDEYINLNEYEIVNISGLENTYSTTDAIKAKISSIGFSKFEIRTIILATTILRGSIFSSTSIKNTFLTVPTFLSRRIWNTILNTSAIVNYFIIKKLTLISIVRTIP